MRHDKRDSTRARTVRSLFFSGEFSEAQVHLKKLDIDYRQIFSCRSVLLTLPSDRRHPVGFSNRGDNCVSTVKLPVAFHREFIALTTTKQPTVAPYGGCAWPKSPRPPDGLQPKATEQQLRFYHRSFFRTGLRQPRTTSILPSVIFLQCNQKRTAILSSLIFSVGTHQPRTTVIIPSVIFF